LEFAVRRPFGSRPGARRTAGLPQPRTLGILLGAGRIGLGGTFLLTPEFAVRMVGLDAASARRVVWLSKMTAGRDIALGVGALATAATGRDYSAWVAAGAAADAVDSIAVAQAVRCGRLGGSAPVGVAVGAAAAAVAGFWAAARGRPSR
jgi:hypothetical protein